MSFERRLEDISRFGENSGLCFVRLLVKEGVLLLLQWRRVEAAECRLHRFGALAEGRRDGKRPLKDKCHVERLSRSVGVEVREELVE